MRRPLLVFAAALAVAGSLAACGESDDEQVRAVVERFADAGAKQDYQRICDELITPALSQKVEQIGLPCEVALKKGFEDVQDPRLTVGTVSVDGDRATAGVRSSAAGEAPSQDTLELVRVGDGWRIASLGR